MKAQNLLFLVLLGMVLAAGCTSKPQTYTGIVTTTMCGTKHFPGMTPAECVRRCVKDGSQYALVVGDKLYKLDGNTAGLDEYAAGKVSVFGTAKGDIIHVSSVSAPKE